MTQHLNFVDAVYVINQNINIYYLIEDINAKCFLNVVILSTQMLFNSERDTIIKNTESQNIIFTAFSDYLSDEEMFSCDKRSIESFFNMPYNTQIFMTKSLNYKNQIVADKILNSFKFNQLFYLEGLGISNVVWCNLSNATKINQKIKVKPKYNFFRKIFTLFNKTIETTTIKHQNKTYLFIGSIHRLKLINNINLQNRKFNYFLLIIFLKIKLLKADYLCTTIHNYTTKISILDNSIYVFVDGYHPSNYPESYLPTYKKNTLFVIRDYIDGLWFAKFNRKISLPPVFVQKEQMLLVKSENYNIKNIILILNHAGDWTSLINRSDTDILIEGFISLSEHFNEYNFIIRVHPTMTHELHEGKTSIKRIEKYIDSLNKAKLSFSKSSLEHDIKTGDLFITEYSNAFIDILKMGKLGIIAHFTNRRSFMKDYEDIGFLHAKNFDEFLIIVKSTLNNLSDAINKQNVAARKYNEMQDKLYRELVRL